MPYYFDSSALIKRYAPEAGTAWVKQLFNSSSVSQVYFVQITSIEIAAGLSRKVRMKEISLKHYHLVLQLFSNDLDKGDYNVVPVSDEIVNLAIALTKRHPLRAYDALHLATASHLNTTLVSANLSPITFISADLELVTAAQGEGLPVDNPNRY